MDRRKDPAFNQLVRKHDENKTVGVERMVDLLRWMRDNDVPDNEDVVAHTMKHLNWLSQDPDNRWPMPENKPFVRALTDAAVIGYADLFLSALDYLELEGELDED